MKTDAHDLSAVRLTEPHNVLEQPVEPHLPHLLRETDDAAARKMAEDIKALMLRSYEVLKDHPINQKRVAEGKLPANMIWPWGAATAMELPSFKEKIRPLGHSGQRRSAGMGHRRSSRTEKRPMWKGPTAIWTPTMREK